MKKKEVSRPVINHWLFHHYNVTLYNMTYPRVPFAQVTVIVRLQVKFMTAITFPKLYTIIIIDEQTETSRTAY